MGTPQAAVPPLERLLSDGHEIVAVYAQPDRPSGRGNRVAFSPVKVSALEHGLPVYQPLKLRTDEAAETFRSFQADTAVVVAYGRILPGAFLSAFEMGAINVHFSLLPKYRGAAPVNWAIVNGESETGVTTMQMDEGLDTGDILLQRAISIGPDETAIDLMARLSIMGADLISETLSSYRTIQRQSSGRFIGEPGTYTEERRRQDRLAICRLQEIAYRIRGFQPFPTAFTTFRNARLTIWKAAVLESEFGREVIPGKVLRAGGDELQIGCGGNSVLSISELQLEGKRRLPTRDFLNGLTIAEGDILGG